MSWQADAIEHASREAPREACGLVVDGVYRPCRNVSDRADGFEISPQDYAAAEDAGEIEAVFHSHPLGTAEPSEHDVAAQRASGLAWHILGGDGAWWIILHA